MVNILANFHYNINGYPKDQNSLNDLATLLKGIKGNEITQLQIEDAKLHQSVVNIRNMIQAKCKDKICKNCKVFEEQIVWLKNHEKETLSFLQEKANRLEEENKFLRQNSNFPNCNKQYYEVMAKDSHKVMPDPQISLYIAQLEQKTSYFEEQSRNLQKELSEKSKQKQQDSMRIINLIDEVQNGRREFQNMNRFYQSQSALMQQEKARIVYELTSKIRGSQNQINNLKTFIQTLYKQKESSQNNLQTIHSESFNLKRQCEHLKILLSQSQNQVHTFIQEQASKSGQFNALAQQHSKLQEETISLNYKIAQQTQINIQTNKRLNALQVEVAELKNENYALQSRSNRENESSQEINYLSKLLQQNKLILDSKQAQISQMNEQIKSLKRQNQSLNDCIQDQFSTIEKAERISAIQNDAIKALNRQKQNLTYKLESLQAEKQHLEQDLNKETVTNSEFHQIIATKTEKYHQLNQKYENIERQLEETKRCKIQAQKVSDADKQTEDNILSEQIMRLKLQNDTLSHEILALKSSKKVLQIQINQQNNQLQLNKNVKESKQKQIEAKQRQIDQLVYFNHQMYDQLQQLKDNNAVLINKIREIESIIFQLEQNNAFLSKQQDQLQKQKIILQQLINELKKEKQSLIQDQQPQKQAFSQKLGLLENQLVQTKMQIFEKQRLFQVERQSNMVQVNHKKQLQNLNHQLIIQNSRLKQRQNELLNQIKQQLSLKQAQIGQLKAQLKNKNESIAHNFNQSEIDLINLQELYDQNVQKYEKLIESQRIANENIIYLKEKLESMNKVYSQSSTDQKDHQQLLKQLNKKKQTITELLTNFKYLEKTLNKKESEFDHLKQEHQRYCKQAQRQKLEMVEKLSLRQKQISALKRQRDDELRQNASKFKDLQKLIHSLQDETKQKQKVYNEDKRKFEKQFAILTEEKRKREQSSARQIITLRQSLQTQKKRSTETSLNSSPAKGDDSKKRQKQIETLRKTVNQNAIKLTQLQQEISEKDKQIKKLRDQRKADQQIIHETNEHLSQTSVHLDVKQKELQQALKNNKKLQEQLNTTKSQLSKKTLELQKIKQQITVKQKQHSLLQQNIRNIELKYQQLNKQTTEKNLSYDYQWMQLAESNNKVQKLQKQLNENRKYLESIRQKGQGLKESKTNSPQHAMADISGGGLLPFDSDKIIQNLNIKRIQSLTVPLEYEDAQESLPISFNNARIDEIPPSSLERIYLPQEGAIHQEQKVETANIEKNVNLEGEVKEVQKKKSGKNLLFQQTLSDAISDAEENDEINEMLTNKDSDHRSHKQLSIEAFSEYSRIKSTRSELNHKQVEEQYKNKIKTAKMLSKLTRPNKKK